MGTTNCWEYKKCERQPGGAKTGELGVCPAATMTAADGFCGGKNGGRACAYITGTFCGGAQQGDAASKAKNCGECDFYKEVKTEHGPALSVIKFQLHVRGAA